MEINKTNDKVIIYIEDMTGEFSYELRIQSFELINKGVKKFEFNMSRCNFISAVGLGVIISIHKKSNITVVLKNVNDIVLDVLRKTRMDRVLRIE